MRLAHQRPDGFSARHRPEQHFTTSVQVGNHVARYLMSRVAELDIDDPWIVDVGAGSGTLLRQLIALGFPPSRLHGVDVRARPADLDVAWTQAVAPAGVPQVHGLLFAHEFLDDIPVDLVRDGWVLTVDGDPLAPASPSDLEWLRRWAGGDSGVVGAPRDVAWAQLAGRLVAGEAIAVDFAGTGPLGYRWGREVMPVPDGRTDICFGVDLRSCRAVTGGRVIPQHRVLAGLAARSATERAELAVLRDRNGLGAFGWLFTQLPSIGSPA